MEVRCADVSASPQLLVLRCPLKLPDAKDLRQAGHCLVRDSWLGGGSRGGDGDGDGWEGDGGRSDDRDDGAAASAARRGGISTRRENARPPDQLTSPTTTGTGYRCLTRVGPWPNVDLYGVPQGSSPAPMPSNQTKACCLMRQNRSAVNNTPMSPDSGFQPFARGSQARRLGLK